MLAAITAIVIYFVFQYIPATKQLPIDKRDLIAQKPIPKEGDTKNADSANVKSLISLEKEFARIAAPFESASPLTMKRIWVEGSSFFVEYENEKGEPRQLLVERKGSTYQAKALFAGSEGGGWSLVKGEGIYADPSALLYEKNAKGEWTKRN